MAKFIDGILTNFLKVKTTAQTLFWENNKNSGLWIKLNVFFFL